MALHDKRYTDLNTYLRNLFGCRVQKISIDAGLSCPNRDGTISRGGCSYCNARGSGTGAHTLGFSVTDQLLKSRQALARRYKAKKFIAYFQSYTNTYARLSTLKALYSEALAVEDIVGLSIGTRPDCVNEAILDLLQEYASNYLVWIEYGLQSANDKTLKRINRGHDVQCFKKAVALTKNRGIMICAHIILGLPGENRDQMLKTADFIASMGIDGIKLHLLYVVKDTPMEHLYRKGKYTCLEQLEYVDLVCDFLERIPSNIVIQRLTGDPHPEELVAPRWSLKKTETLNLIRRTLETRDSMQGKYCP
ncbi:MAG: TIGR01212 family radical SAM protein [Desulfobacteraceae bacterium 4572_123]|nr:MAG: TIGR01212 family radical SAM protein [Desulfobacteraceae bacterium 4572_123]